MIQMVYIIALLYFNIYLRLCCFKYQEEITTSFLIVIFLEVNSNIK
jgi:hypothetical protein